MLPLFKVHETLYDICHILFRQAVEHWQTHQALALFCCVFVLSVENTELLSGRGGMERNVMEDTHHTALFHILDQFCTHFQISCLDEVHMCIMYTAFRHNRLLDLSSLSQRTELLMVIVVDGHPLSVDFLMFLEFCKQVSRIHIARQIGGTVVDPGIFVDLSAEKLAAEGQRNSTLSRIAGRLVKRFGVTDEARQKFLDKAAECNPPLDDTELESIWNSACKFGSKVTSQDGYVPPDQFGQNPLLPDDFSDVGEARTFVDCFGEEITFTVATNYLRYNGVYWEESEQAAVMAMIEHTDAQLSDAESKMEEHLCALEKLGVPRMLAKAGGKKFRDSLNPEQGAAYGLFRFSEIYHDFVMKYRNIRSLNNALDAAKPLVLKHPEQLDGNPMLLNTPGGTYDLTKGINGWRATDPADLITKVTAVVPNEEGRQLWEEALQVFFCSDQSLIDYVQMICGLCLIGKVYTEAMIIAYGDGRNGKSTFWNVIYKVLGSYSGNISADALTVNCKRNVKPEMAELKGKRLIIAAELQEGMRLNTSVVKQLCSTDPIFAEKKFKASFSFEPSHTLVLYTNHLPKVSASDDGTWRRLIVIPFHAKIQGQADKKNYTQYLIDNAGGAVLSWLIEGAMKVVAADFKVDRPQCVLDAIGAYRDGNDWLGAFINDCCDVDASYQEKSGELYKRYREYCIENGEYVRSTTDFYGALEQAGYKRKKLNSGITIYGLQIRLEFLD